MACDAAADWVDVDVRSTGPGWRVVELTEDGSDVRSLVGWLVQESEDGKRRIVAATVDDDGRVVPVAECASFWKVLAPEDRVPTWDEAMAEHGRRVEIVREMERASVPVMPEWLEIGEEDDE